MGDIQYIGEHLLPGRIGQALIVLAFVTALLSTAAFFFKVKTEAHPEAGGWLRIGRTAFLIHAASIMGIIGCMAFAMLNQYYEYQYVTDHVSSDLQSRYIFSAFWEGQEGSFLLWMFWHCILGMIVWLRSGKWTAPVLAVLSAIQVFLVSMILGIYITPEFKLGSNPLLLLRQVFPEAPVFSNPNYLQLLSGKGLNPILQNYWMTIHPPTLFLGFAACTIPFCYAVSGFWTRRTKEWLKPAFPWALFAAGILGTGVAMGGAWAYEALSFGGYWAWDPVENASLVPWLILIAGIHTHLIARSTGHSLKATYVLYTLTFLLILYSTFLTRSGILGDTSVHAFTEMGLEWQLIIFMLAFVILSGYFYFKGKKDMIAPSEEEHFSSREFWMFMGVLVLIFSSVLITFTTSIPVYNKLFDAVGWITGTDLSSLHRTSPIDPEAHYNRYQMWIAFLVMLLAGGALWLRYKETRWNSYYVKYWKRAGIQLLVSIGLAVGLNQWIKADQLPHILLLGACCFAIVSNVDYLVNFIRLKMRHAASVFAHLGFGLMILGVLASGLNKTFISSNPFAMRGIFSEGDERLEKNVYLVKNKPMFIKGYQVTYLTDTLVNHDRIYSVSFSQIADSISEVKSFITEPYITYNNDFTEAANANPSIKRNWFRDIFTHIVAVPPEFHSVEAAKANEDSLKYELVDLKLNNFRQVGRHDVFLESFDLFPTHPDYEREAGDLAFGVRVLFRDTLNGEIAEARPMLAIKKGTYVYNYPVHLNDQRIKIRLTEQALNQVFPGDGTLDYKSFHLLQGEEIVYSDLAVNFLGLDRNPSHPNYQPEENDIAVAAVLKISGKDELERQSRPIFLIRDNQTFFIKDFLPEIGLTTRFTSIDPRTETMEIQFARTDVENQSIPVAIAQDVPRSDYIVLEAIIFPGINFFWLGCLLMVCGLFLAMVYKIRSS